MNTGKYILFCIAFLAAACERDVDFKGNEPDPKMTVGAIINGTDGEHTLMIAESVFLFGDKNPEMIRDAELRLQLNGEDVPLTFREEKDNRSYYGFTAGIASGDRLEMWGESPKHGKVHGVDHVPYPAEIKDVKTEWFTGDKDERSYLRALITIADKPGKKNFYRIVIRSRDVYGDAPDEEREWMQQEVFVDQEILFNNIDGMTGEDESAHRHRIFSDELIDGQQYTLNVYIQMDRYDPWGSGITERQVKVELHTLSENLFKYLRSLELAMSEDNFSEPVKIYSNIENGYGILGAYNVAEKIIILPVQ